MAEITCNTGTVTPTNNELIKCNEIKSSDCTVFEQAIVYLELPVNSTLTSVMSAILTSLINARERIEILENS